MGDAFFNLKPSNIQAIPSFLAGIAGIAVGRKLAVMMHRMLVDQKEFIYGEPPQTNKAA